MRLSQKTIFKPSLAEYIPQGGLIVLRQPLNIKLRLFNFAFTDHLIHQLRGQTGDDYP